MSAAVALGGFTGPEADTLGYAIRKKKSSVLRAQKEKFVTQAAERGVEPKVIDAVFKAFEPFERYGFNKAHATCYGLIAYQTAYLKANYTVEYMTSVLTAFRDNAEKVAAAVAECRRLGIEVRPAGRPPLGARVHGRGRLDPVRAAGGQERRRGRDRVDHRGARERRRVPLADRLLLAGRRAARQPQGARVAGARSGRSTWSGTRRRSCSASTTRSPRARRRSATGSPARPRCSTSGGDDARGPRAAAPRDARDAGPRAAALGEGAARAVPLRPPDGRGRGAGRPVRDGLLRRPEGRVARRAAGRPRRDRDRDPDRDHEVEVDDGRRDARGPPGDARGRRLPADLRADDRDVARRRDPARRGPGRPPGRGGVAARRRRLGLGHGRRPRDRRRSRARSGRSTGAAAGGAAGRAASRRTATATGNGGGATGAGRGRAGQGSGRSRRGRRRRRRCARARVADPRVRRSRRRTCRASPRASRSRPTRSRRTSPRPRWPRASRSPTSRRSPTSSATSPRRPPRRPASRWTRRPARCSTSGSRATPGPTVSCPRCRRSRTCCASGPGGTRVVVHVPAPGGSALPMELRGVAYDAELLARGAAPGRRGGHRPQPRLNPRRGVERRAAGAAAAAGGSACAGDLGRVDRAVRVPVGGASRDGEDDAHDDERHRDPDAVGLVPRARRRRRRGRRRRRRRRTRRARCRARRPGGCRTPSRSRRRRGRRR